MPEPRQAPSTMPSGFHLVLAGGGSGGHVFPALAVADEVRRRGGRVSFVGSEHGMEARLVTQREVPFHALPARPVVGRGLFGKLWAVWTLAGSALRARGLLRRLEATAVLATGGYVSVGPGLGARLSGRPLVLLEPNAHPGAANRTLSRFAAGACVAWPEVGLRCPTWDTGVPVRSTFFETERELPAGPVRLLVLGGSQGSEQLNRLLPEALAQVEPPPAGLRVLHQAGERHADATRTGYAALTARFEVTVVPFVSDVAAEMAASHLVVSRAGAITLAELCAAARGSILIPLALAEGHQRANAEAMAGAGASKLFDAAEMAPGSLAITLQNLLWDRQALQGMARAAERLARPRAVADITERLLEAAA